MSSLDPPAEDAATRPSRSSPGADRLNPLATGPLGSITQARPACPCHDAADCPNEATLTVSAAELARLGELLTGIDAFLRCGNGVAERLADFYARRGHPHPRFAAANLIDAVGFAAAGPRRRVETGGHDVGGDQ